MMMKSRKPKKFSKAQQAIAEAFQRDMESKQQFSTLTEKKDALKELLEIDEWLLETIAQMCDFGPDTLGRHKVSFEAYEDRNPILYGKLIAIWNQVIHRHDGEEKKLEEVLKDDK